MAFITLRQANVVVSPGGIVKGSPLTNSEVDNNFANINIVIGFRENLTTTANDNLVAAVNEVRSDLDNLSSDSISNGTSNVSISTTDGPIVISANLIPNSSNVINLGSNTNRFKDLFLSGNTINLGGDTISSVGGFVRVNNNNVFTTTGNIVGDGSTLNNINASNITSGTLAVTRGGTGSSTSTGSGSVVLATSPTLITPALGTPTSGNLTSCVSLPIDGGTAGTLPVARGGTGGTTSTGTGAVVLASSPTLTTPNLGTPASGNLTSCVSLPIDGGTAGTLPVARGGTGGTTSTGTGAVVLATSPTLVTPALGTPASGNLTSCVSLPIDGGTSGTLPVARGGTGGTTSTGTGDVVLATSPTLTTPNLGTPSAGTLTNCTFPTLNQNTTGSAATFTSTTQNSQFNSIGVGTAGSGTGGEIRATNNVTAYFSDKRLKTNITSIADALNKVCKISGVTFQSNDTAAKYGYTDQKVQVGVIAQEVKEVLPQVVVPAPFDIGKDEDGKDYSVSGENYMTVHYDKLVPLLIEAIKELKAEVDQLKNSKG